MQDLKIQNVNIWKSNQSLDYRACVLFGKDFDNLLIRRTFWHQTLEGIWDMIKAEALYLQRSSVDASPSKS